MPRWATRLLLTLAITAAYTGPAHAATHGRPSPEHLPDRGARWVFVGDSLTRGWRVDPDQAFPEVFDQNTPTAYAVNLGRNGSCLIAHGCYSWRPWVDDFTDAVYPARATRTPARLVVLLGANDLCRPGITPDQLEDGYRQLAATAAAHATPITFLTLLPQAPPQHAYCEDDRTAVNTWLLASGLDVVDVATPLADPATGYLRPEYDADDGLHINAAGQAAVAATLERWRTTRAR